MTLGPDTVREQDREAACYERYYAKRSLYWSFNVTGKVRSFSRLCRTFGVPMSGGRVLDVGFGSGAMLLQFAPDCELTGVELSRTAVERVARKAAALGRRNVDLRVWDVGENGLPSFTSQFDVVILSHVLEHVPDDRRLLGAVRDVLAPGGSLVVMVPLEDPSELIGESHVRAYDEAAIRGAIEKAGFSVVGAAADHSIDNWFRWLTRTRLLAPLPFVRDRLLGSLSVVCTLVVGVERLPWFGPPRNLGVVATHSLRTRAPVRVDAVLSPPSRAERKGKA